MFICKDCLKKYYENEWYEFEFLLSYGPCELCGKTCTCTDIPSRCLHLKNEKSSPGSMSLKEMQIEVIANRIRRKWPSASDIRRTIDGLAEEVGEFAKAVKHNDTPEMIDALGDIMVFCLGGLEILKADAQDVLEKIIENNKTRMHTGFH